MKVKIGTLAGKIWETLQKNGEVNITQLSKNLTAKSTEVYQALGWLAREDKINYSTKGSKIFVSLINTQ